MPVDPALANQLAQSGITLPTGAPPPAPPPNPQQVAQQAAQDALIHKIALANAGQPNYSIGPAPNRQPFDPGLALANAGVMNVPSSIASVPQPTPEETPSGLVFGKKAKPVAGGAYVNPYGDYFKSREDERKAYGDVGRAEEHSNENESVANAMRGEEQARQQYEIQEKARERDAEVGRQMGKLDDLSRDAASAKIDPDRWYKKQSTAQSLGWTLASMFGGAAQGWNHGAGGNPALEMMKSHVDNDLAAQREEIESKRGRVADQKGILGETYRRYGNMEQAESAARILSLQKLDSQAASYAASSKTEGTQAKYGLIQAQLNSEIAKEKASLTAKAAAAADANPKGLGAYGEALDKGGIPDAVSRLQRLEDMYSGGATPEGTSGIALMAGKSPTTARLLSQKARDNQADIEQAVLAYAKATGRVNENEVNMVRSALQGAAPNSDAVRHMIGNYKADLGARAKNIDASTDPRVVAAYRARGGVDTSRLAAPPAKPPPTGFKGASQ